MFQHSHNSENQKTSEPSLQAMNRLLAEAHSLLVSRRDLFREGSPSEQRYLSALSMAFKHATECKVAYKEIAAQITSPFYQVRDAIQSINPRSFLTSETVVHTDAIDFQTLWQGRLLGINTERGVEEELSSDLSAYSFRRSNNRIIPSPEILLKCAREWRAQEVFLIDEFAAAVGACKGDPGNRDKEMDLSLASRVAVTNFLELTTSTEICHQRIREALFSLLQDSIHVARIESIRINLERRAHHVSEELKHKGLL